MVNQKFVRCVILIHALGTHPVRRAIPIRGAAEARHRIEQRSQDLTTPRIPTPIWLLVARVVPALILLACTLLAGPSVGAAAPGNGDQWTPVYSRDFADPDVMLYQGTYYGYATQSFADAAQTINIQSATSPDGVHWTAGPDAMPTLPSWAQPTTDLANKDTWAPSVVHNAVDNDFIMYFAATDALSGPADGDQCIGMAVSTSPSGPFVDNSSAPFICQSNYGGSIDPDIFTEGGVSVLIWKSDGDHIGAPTYIWSQPLSSNLMSLTGTPVEILGSDQSWQAGIVEGPDMVAIGGVDYLFYAGNDEGTVSYGIGYAVCSGGSVEAMCRRSEPDPDVCHRHVRARRSVDLCLTLGSAADGF